jgi:hypothetical protein
MYFYTVLRLSAAKCRGPGGRGIKPLFAANRGLRPDNFKGFVKKRGTAGFIRMKDCAIMTLFVIKGLKM